MKRVLTSLCLVMLVMGAAACTPAPPPAPAPPPPSTAIRDSIAGPYNTVKGYITKALPLVPDNRLNFRPTPDVRSLGQLFGHVADANYLFCGVVAGSRPEGTGKAEELKTKAELSKALADSFAYCDKALDSLNDQTGAAAVTIEFINNMPSTKLGVMAFNSAHDWEHYGNIVTYLRLNKIVPPSSAPSGSQ
jgi:uncharacterized damage-inducible protein DinB